MNCNEVQQKLVSYLDKAVSDQERQDIEQHLAVCSACREELGALANIQAVFHQAFKETAAGAYPSVRAWIEFTRRMGKHKRRNTSTFGWAKTLFAGFRRLFGVRRLWQTAFAVVLIAAITTALLVIDPFARISPSGVFASAAEATGSVQSLHASVDTTGDYQASYEIDYTSSGEWNLTDNSPESDSAYYRNVDDTLYSRSSSEAGWLKKGEPQIPQINEAIAQIDPTANAEKLTWLSEGENAVEIEVLPDEVINGINCVHYKGTYSADENDPIIIEYWIGKSDYHIYKQSYSGTWMTTSNINLYGNFFAQGTTINTTTTTTFTAIDQPVIIQVPSISDIQVSITDISMVGITGTEATINWTTNTPATSQVEYGITSAYGSSTIVNTTLKESHSVNITALAPNTTYHYRVISKDSDGAQKISPGNTFTTNSCIAFSSNRDGNMEIYVMNTDGTGQTNITNNSADDTRPAWSPDGSKIAFTTKRDGNWEIYTMDTDGSNLTRLTDDSAVDFRPAWSPDGSKIAFYSDRDGNREIYVMNADGTGQIRLTDDPAADRTPTWSSDGSKIAFYSDRDGNTEIYVMDADGRNQTNITNSDTIDQYPAWSPDGSKITFTSNRDDGYEIYTMNPDGTNVTRLTDSSGANYFSSWSSDSSMIAFAGGTQATVNYIYIMNADGTGQTRLTDNPAKDENPTWAP